MQEVHLSPGHLLNYISLLVSHNGRKYFPSFSEGPMRRLRSQLAQNVFLIKWIEVYKNIFIEDKLGLH